MDRFIFTIRKGTLFSLSVLVILSALLPACVPGSTAGTTIPELDIQAQEQAVYAFLFAEIYGEPQMYVLREQTTPGIEGVEGLPLVISTILPQFTGLDAETAESFQLRNTSAASLAPDMDLVLPYVLLTQADFDQIFALNTSGWEVFYTRYPNSPGLITVSQVGFNADLSQALLYAATYSNWLAGAGYYYLLERSSGTWQIIQQVMAWVS